jgi:hypothetical protein
MRIGIDFDNTIVRYDELFARMAVERGMIEAGSDALQSKTSIRDDLRRRGLEAEWTRMQGEAYGPRIGEAAPFPGVLEFLRQCRGVRVSIISHKTVHPFAGAAHNLHAAAYGWLARKRFFTADIGLSPDDVYFETTKEAKVARIAAAGCDVFIDDLTDILLHPAFPAGVERVLFAPAGDSSPRILPAGEDSQRDASDSVRRGPWTPSDKDESNYRPPCRELRSWAEAGEVLFQKVMS